MKALKEEKSNYNMTNNNHKNWSDNLVPLVAKVMRSSIIQKINDQLLVENWSDADYNLMPATWESLISPTLYEQYRNTPIPVRNTLATPIATTIVQGQSIDPHQKVTVQLTYVTGLLVTVNVPVKIEQ